MATHTDISTGIRGIITQHLSICIPNREKEKNFGKKPHVNTLDIVEIWIKVEKKSTSVYPMIKLGR